ncbi:MAG TPA: M55 family metallopeptidase [Candidatus Dormibacteraeota bacterium]|nr:M55 family metallopeptidase [Candidatus Dormibacteraeota bacterium]
MATAGSKPSAGRDGVFISVDMEGMAGVVHLHQVMRGTPEYERSCRLMTAETNAAVAGARRAGATRFLVNDSHGDMRNFLLDELDDGVEVISGADKSYSMGAGLDPTFEVAFFVGYHASVGTELAIMDHTYGGRTVYALRINGRAQSEATLNAALAGTFGVRTALITGDRATIDEAAAELPGIEGVVVKEALGRQAARSLHPVEACRRIEEGAYRAYADQAVRPLYRPQGPFTLEIDWMNASMADLCAQLPDIERAGGRTSRYRSPDFQTCYRVLLALLGMAAPAAYQYPRP